MMYLVVFLAGGSGAALRFLVDRLISSSWQGNIPFATLFINATGSLLLGAFTGLLPHLHLTAEHNVMTENISLIIGGGFLGGYTTFSTAMVEAARTQLSLHRAVLTLGQALICICCAATGLALTA